jgi:glycosyltransferase involved in cell wall biosynthesis
MIRIGFTLIGGGVGTGVYNYLINLVASLCEHEAHRVKPVVLFGTDVAEEDILPFRKIIGAELVFTKALDISRRGASLTRALLLGADESQKRLLDELKIDVLFESAQFFGWRIGRPVIAWIPDFQHRHLRHMFSLRGYLRREFGFLTQFMAGRTIMLSSEDARRDCEHFYPLTVRRTRRVRFAVPSGQLLTPVEVRLTADRYGLPEAFFFMPNQVSKHKNHRLVIDALALLRDRGTNAVVVSSGKQLDERHPDYFPGLQRRLNELSLEKELRLLGMIPYADLRALMQASVALLNPSLFEGWSTTVEEARSLGVPMLLSDLAVHREQAGDAAVYFDRHSVTSLANALQTFIPLSAKMRASKQLSARVEANDRVRRFAAEFATLACDCIADTSPLT